jgi:hypothetical protein
MNSKFEQNIDDKVEVVQNLLILMFGVVISMLSRICHAVVPEEVPLYMWDIFGILGFAIAIVSVVFMIRDVFSRKDVNKASVDIINVKE